MSADETEQIPATPGGVMMSVEDWQKIQESMLTYKAIEQKYLAMRGGVARRVVTTFIIADIILFAALWLGFFDWDEALAWALLAFAAQEVTLALITFLGSIFRAS